jgi:LPS sulfotransferase NodH
MQPHTSYLICATQRSGSTLLCELLKNTYLAGYPEEYFDALKSTDVPQRPLEYFSGIIDEALADIFKAREHPDEELRQPPPGMSYEQYVHAMIEKSTSPNGVFGTKVMANYFPDFISKLRDIPGYHDLPTPSLLSTLFPNLHYIFVTRRDKIGQAISLWKGLQTWVWRAEDTTDGGKRTPQELTFHFGAIDRLVQQLEQNEQDWQRFFADHHIQPFTIVFEDFVMTQEETVRNVLQFLHIPIPPEIIFAPPRMQRQADELSAEWTRQYHTYKHNTNPVLKPFLGNDVKR